MLKFAENLENFEREILEAPRVSYWLQLQFYDIFLPVLGSLIILLNLGVVLSSGLILQSRQQPRSTYVFLGNVSLADMLTGIATLFGQYFPKKYRTEEMCAVQIGMIISATLTSVYSILLIAIDRYIYILYGLQYQRYMSSKWARIMVLGPWLIGLIIGFLPAMGIRNSSDTKNFCWLIILEPTGLILLTVTIGLLPLIVIIILYGIILKRALGKISEMRYSQTPSDNKNRLRYFRGGTNASPCPQMQFHSELVNEVTQSNRSLWNCFRSRNYINIAPVQGANRWRAIKIVAFTTGCYFVTWFPYFLACALYAMCDDDATPAFCNNLRIAIASPLAILGLANSLMNPIIYAWWHNGFRTSVTRALNSIWNNLQRKMNINGPSLHQEHIRHANRVNEQGNRVQVTTNTPNITDGATKSQDVCHI